LIKVNIWGGTGRVGRTLQDFRVIIVSLEEAQTPNSTIRASIHTEAILAVGR